jgi:outer membrane biosynthesis protein TonB
VSTRLRAQLVNIKQQLEELQQRHAEVEFSLKYSRKQFDELQRQDASLASLHRILEQIDRLEQLDSIGLLWGESCSDEQAKQHKLRLHTSLTAYDIRVSSAEQRIRELLHERAELEREINILQSQHNRLEDELNRLPPDAVRQPQLTQIVPSQIILPWSNKRNDAVRLRAIMLASLFVALLLGFIIPRWQVPEAERVEYIEIPERLATLIIKKAPPPPPPEPEAKPEEEAEQAEAAEPEPAPEKTETSEARQAADKAGLLAFKQDFAEIMDASANIKMGSQATILTQAPQQRRKPAARSLLTSQLVLPAGSAIPSARVSRTDVIGDDNRLKKVEFSHIETAEVAALDSKQLNKGSTRGRRSDEEIQLVFDRSKDALYRIYNRELRRNSFLKGKLVLLLTIEPSGKVSKCVVDSSELNSAELENKIVARVLKFNFGTKKAASPITIRYPIDFLPAS